MRALLGILGCRLFPFITLNISCHSLLACRVSTEKSAANLMGIPLYVICCFSLVAFNIFSLSLIFSQFAYCVSWCVPPWVYPAWDSLCFLDLSGYFLFHIREIFNYNLFKYFLKHLLLLFFFWDPFNSNCCAFNVVPEVSESVLNSFHSFIFILLLGSYFHHSVLQLTFPFFYLSYSFIDSF